MNLPRLSASEKLAVSGATATVIGGVVAASSYPGHWGVTWIAAILGLAMLAVILVPPLAPTAKLPGKKGSLMIAVGGLAAALMAFVLLTTIDFTFQDFDLPSLLFLLAVAGALVMGGAGWQAFQSEGGTFDVGVSGASSVPPVPMIPPPTMAPPPGTPPSDTGTTRDDDQP